MKIFMTTLCLLSALALGACTSVSSMGMGQRLILGSALAPVGGLIAANVLVTGTYTASEAQKQSAIRIAQRAEARLSPAVRQELLRRGTPYISVKAPSRAPSRPSVMVYDIEKDKLATDQVYEVKEEPKKNSYVEFDTYYSHYVGGEGEEKQDKKQEEEPKP